MTQQQETYKQVDKFIVTTKILGKGQFGTVYKGFFKDDLSKVVAVKQIALENVSKDPKFIKLLKREIEILMKIKSQYIVTMYHATRTPNNLYMFLEHCNDGDLGVLLKKRSGKLTESESVVYFRQITEGFKALHDMNIIHRDIKPANILLKEGKAKISDFGFAKCLDTCGMDEQTKKTYLGTPLYMSPQILMEEPFSSKCDIWSLGMMFYEMLYGKTPWAGKTPWLLLESITKTPLVFPDYPQRSELVKNMLRRMLVINDSDRMSWPELFEHSLIKIDAEDIQKQIDLINQNNDIDPLLRSVEVNRFYLKNNKVVGIDKTQQNKAFKPINGKQEEAKIEEESVKSEQNTQENENSNKQSPYQDKNQVQPLNMTEILQKQENKLQIRRASIKIDSYLTFERNLGIFVNLTTNFIFKQYKDGFFSIQEHLFYRIIFILQKYQLIRFQYLLDVMHGKTKLDICTPEQFECYLKTKEYIQTLQLIQNDNGYIKPYFNEIFGRTMNFLKQFSNEKNIKNFFRILNDDLSKNNDLFDLIFQETLNDFLQIAATKDLNNNNLGQKKRDMLQTLRYVLVCQNLDATFTWKGEDNSIFHEFYDKYDQMPEDQLEIEVSNQLNK